MEEFQTLHHKKYKCLLFSVLALLSIVLTVSIAIDIKDKIEETENTITVFATGEVYAKPDLALTTFSVVTEAETVAEAMTENTEKMNAVIDSMKEEGIEEKDLKTTTFNISPRYEWYYKEACIPPCPSGERILVGYEVQQSLQVKIRDLEKVGALLQKATDAGANQVGNLQFTIEDQDAVKSQARAEAIDEAKAKAKELASQLGVRLIRISSFNESSVLPYYGLEMAEASGRGGGEEPQIEIGENKISVTVYITYDIR